MQGSIAAATLILSGCGGGAAPASTSAAGSTPASAKPAASAAPSAKPSAPGTANAVKGAWVAITANQMLWPLAVEAGYFDKYNVNFALQYIQGSVTSVQALKAGELQMVSVAATAVVAAQAAKQDLIMSMSFVGEVFWRIMALSEITSLEQLKGKTIAVTKVGNADYFAWPLAAQKAGLSLQDFKFAPANDANGQVALLASGQAQAAAFSPPNDVAAQEKAKAHLLLDESSYHIPEQQVGIALSKAYLAQNHDTVLGVTKATIEAIHRWKTDPAFAKNVIKKYLKTDDQQYIDTGWSAYAGLFQQLPYPSRDGFVPVIDEVAQQEASAKEVKPEQCLDTSIVKELDDSGFIKQLYGASYAPSAAASASAAATPAASAKPAASSR